MAFGVNIDGQREVLSWKVGPSEAEPFWIEFLRSLICRDLRDVNSVIQACGHQDSSCEAAESHLAALPGALHAKRPGAAAANLLRGKFLKRGILMDDVENVVLAPMTFPRAHWTRSYIAKPLERLIAEMDRCANVVLFFPNDASTTGLVGATFLEQTTSSRSSGNTCKLEGLQTMSDTAPDRQSQVAR